MPLGAARIALLAKTQVVAAAEVIRKKQGIQANGNAQTDTAISKFGGSSLLLDGTGDYLEIKPQNFSFGTGDFTIEQWIYQDNYSANYDMCRMNDASNNLEIAIIVTSSEKLNVYINGSLIFDLNNTQHPLNLTTWHHIALTRSSGTLRLFVDGTQYGGDVSNSADLADIATYTIGWNQSGGFPSYWDGNIDEVRISDTARYTSGFTSSTTPFVNDDDTLLLLHMDGTDGSTYFEDDNSVALVGEGVDMAGDNVYYDTSISSTVPDGRYLTIGLLWKNPSTSLGTIFDWDAGINDGNQTVKDIWVQTDGQLEFLVRKPGVGVYAQSETGYADDEWHQGLIVYDSVANTQKMYIDGVEQTINVSYSTMSGNIPYSELDGLIAFGEFYDLDNFRNYPGDVAYFWLDNSYNDDPDAFWDYASNKPKYMGTDGTATGLSQPLIYHYGNTSTFPTNNGTGTGISYSLSTAGTFADSTDKPNYKEIRNIITANGGAQIDTAQSEYGGSSALFDGTDDYLTSTPRASTDYDLSTNWTIEFWMRATLQGGEYPAVFYYGNQNTSKGWAIELGPSGNLTWISSNDGSSGMSIRMNTATGIITTNTWHHCAISVEGTSGAIFVDGTRRATGSGVDPVAGDSSSVLRIGGGQGGLSGGNFGGNTSIVWLTGHLDEIRISNTARYSVSETSVTAPTEPFQNDANTLFLLHCDGTDGDTDFVDDNGKESE